MEVNKKLVSLRKKKGFSQAELAEKINVSRQTISRWEVGTALPTAENLKYLSQIYEVSLEYLLSEDKDEKEEPIELEGKEPCHAEVVEHTKKRVYYRRCYVMIALVMLTIGIVIGWAIHKSVETEQDQKKIVPIEAMDWDKLSGEIKEEDFS